MIQNLSRFHICGLPEIRLVLMDEMFEGDGAAIDYSTIDPAYIATVAADFAADVPVCLDYEGVEGGVQGLDLWHFGTNLATATSLRTEALAAWQLARPDISFGLYGVPFRRTVDGTWASDEQTASACIQNAQILYPESYYWSFTASVASWEATLDAKLTAASTYTPNKPIVALIAHSNREDGPDEKVLTAVEYEVIIQIADGKTSETAYWINTSKNEYIAWDIKQVLLRN